jgi:hypothetical protein
MWLGSHSRRGCAAKPHGAGLELLGRMGRLHGDVPGGVAGNPGWAIRIVVVPPAGRPARGLAAVSAALGSGARSRPTFPIMLRACSMSPHSSRCPRMAVRRWRAVQRLAGWQVKPRAVAWRPFEGNPAPNHFRGRVCLPPSKRHHSVVDGRPLPPSSLGCGQTAPGAGYAETLNRLLCHGAAAGRLPGVVERIRPVPMPVAGGWSVPAGGSRYACGHGHGIHVATCLRDTCPGRAAAMKRAWTMRVSELQIASHFCDAVL